jgi:hypothetical protein
MSASAGHHMKESGSRKRDSCYADSFRLRASVLSDA